MAAPKTWKGVVNHFKRAPAEVQRYFEHFPALAAEFPWEVSLAYVFSRLELAHNMALYCGAVKLHRADGGLTRAVIQKHHLTREGFRTMFKTIHGASLPDAVLEKIGEAEAVRDKVMHGKHTTGEEQRKAIADVFDYAVLLNNFVYKNSGFRPFDDLRGFKGRAKPLDKSTTRWLLKGMGFNA